MLASLFIPLVAVGVLAHDPAAPLFIGGLAGAGIALGVLNLERHALFADRQLLARQRRTIAGLVTVTVAVYGAALIVAVTSGAAAKFPLGLATVLGLGSATYASIAHLARLRDR